MCHIERSEISLSLRDLRKQIEAIQNQILRKLWIFRVRFCDSQNLP
ncbi:hypothetical protein [Helicobacter sp. 23-1045]